jgi:hypothetical protein
MDNIYHLNHDDGVGICAGQAQHREEVTEDMLKVIRATKRKCGDPGNLREGCEKATDTATEGQLGTQSGSHDGRIMKRAADSQVSIKGHSCQETNLTDACGMEEIHLQDATIQRNTPSFTKQAREHLWDGGSGVPYLQEGKGTDEEVHGCVEVCVELDHCDDNQVPNDNESIDEEQWDEADDRISPGARESRKNELLSSGPIGEPHLQVRNESVNNSQSTQAFQEVSTIVLW